MTLRVIGAGLGRTATTSLKLALERLLGGPCYHMYELLARPDHMRRWHAIVRGREPDWDSIYSGFVATVDWPGAAYWKPLSEAYPDALVILSTRSDPSTWFRSADATITDLMTWQRNGPLWHAMASDLFAVTFTPTPFVEADAIAAYERHNDEVLAQVPSERLLHWQATDGWEPLCSRLGIAVPADPFPHTNTTEDFPSTTDARPGDGEVARAKAL